MTAERFGEPGGGISQITAASAPRPGKRRNEDLVGVSDSAAWVLDGASGAGEAQCCDRGAAWYVRRLSAALGDALTAEGDLEGALATAIASVAAEHRAVCPRLDESTGPSATVTVVRQREGQIHWLILGDSCLLVETDQGVSHHSDKRLAEVAPELRREIREALRSGEGYGSEAHLRRVHELREQERAVRNKDGGYWIAAYEPGAAGHSLAGTYPVGESRGEARRLALLTDGLERAVSTFRIWPLWSDLLRALSDDGPASCILRIRAAELADPEGVDRPRTSDSDDASGIVWQLVRFGASLPDGL